MIPYIFFLAFPADAETLRQLGYSAWALCGLGGKLEPADLAAIQRRQQVHIATDSDAAGCEAMTKLDAKVGQLATALGPLTMIMPPLPEGKDFNGALQLGALDSAMLASLIKGSCTWLEKRIDQARDCQMIRIMCLPIWMNCYYSLLMIRRFENG
jgi:hypothetical protein